MFRKDEPNIFKKSKVRSEKTKDFFSYCKQEYKKIEINNTVFFIVENCLLYSEKELFLYANKWQRIMDAKTMNNYGILNTQNIDNIIGFPPVEPSLIGGISNSMWVKWKEGTVISYHIDKSTFSEENYNIVREIVPKAASEWEKTCRVKFSIVLILTILRQITGQMILSLAFFIRI
jgi:hypothetical protein